MLTPQGIRYRGDVRIAPITAQTKLKHMAQPERAIRLAWMEQDPPTGRMHLSWYAQLEDGSWKQERATLEPGETHPLLQRCKDAAADFARRERGTTPS